MAKPYMNSLSGAIVIAPPIDGLIFMRNSVRLLNISLNVIMKIVPKTEPGMLPSPPMMIMAMYSMDSHKLNGSGVMLII